MKPAEQAKWISDGKAAATATVAYAKKNHPELALTEADIRVDFEKIEARGEHVIAMGGEDAGRRIAVVGFRFVERAKINPAYVLSDIVHELRGHPEYGAYGTEYGLALYDKAAAKIKGYSRPAGAERTVEIDAYAYQETELYALMRELPYFRPVSKADAAKGVWRGDPVDLIANRIENIKQQWEPRVAIALLHGLIVRFRSDPRIAAGAVAAFEAGIRKLFKEAEAKSILAR
jgi:hypothetical protein